MSKTQERITPENVGVVKSSVKDKKAVKKVVETPFVCEICGKGFKSKGGLTKHKKVCKPEVVEVVEPVVVEEVSFEESTKWITQYIHGSLNNKPLVKQLSQEDRVTFIIPKTDSESKSAVMEAKINGQAFAYPKGVYIEIPKSMAILLKGSVEAEVRAGNKSLSNRSDEVKNILS